MFDTKRFDEIAKSPSRFRLLEQIPLSADDIFPIRLHQSAGNEICLALIDFVTAGFTAGENEVIEIGIVEHSRYAAEY